jgi:hypothetical protein
MLRCRWRPSPPDDSRGARFTPRRSARSSPPGCPSRSKQTSQRDAEVAPESAHRWAVVVGFTTPKTHWVQCPAFGRKNSKKANFHAIGCGRCVRRPIPDPARGRSKGGRNFIGAARGSCLATVCPGLASPRNSRRWHCICQSVVVCGLPARSGWTARACRETRRAAGGRSGGEFECAAYLYH